MRYWRSKIAENAALREEVRQTGTKTLYADESYFLFLADAELRSKWVLKGEPALVDTIIPSY